MNNTNRKTVEDYLAEVNYDFPGYIPSEAAIKFIEFIKLVNHSRGGESNKNPVVHMKMLDSVFNSHKRTAILCHRGIAKTTLMAEYMFLYIAVFGKLDGFGKVDFAMYVSDSMENGCRNLRKNLEFRYNDSDFLQQQLPDIRFTDSLIEFTNKSGNRFALKLYGAQSGIRGSKLLGKRANLAILDDLISDSDAKSPTVINSIEDTVFKAVAQALDPMKSKIIWSGTPFSKADPLVKTIENGGGSTWQVSVYPVCEEFNEFTTKENFKGSWEDRFSYEFVKDQFEASKAQGKLQGFYQELMLRVVSDDERVILNEDIVEYDYLDMKDNLHNLNIYITTDFATSEKKSSDYSAILVWGVNSVGDWILLDGIANRQLMNKNIDQLFRFVQIYKPMSVGVEIAGVQKGFIDWIKKEMIHRNIYFHLASSNNSNEEGIRPRKNKLERMMQVQPRFKQKKIWVPHNHRVEVVNELKNELFSITHGGIKAQHDDLLDCLSMMQEMPIIEPSTDTLKIYDPLDDTWKDEEDNYNGGNSYIID